jgi:hypothetical protein
MPRRLARKCRFSEISPGLLARSQVKRGDCFRLAG